MAYVAAPRNGYLSENERGAEVISTIGGNGTNTASLTFPDPLISYQQGQSEQNSLTQGYPT